MGRTCRDKAQIRDAKSPSQATAVGQLGGNRGGLLPRNGPEEWLNTWLQSQATWVLILILFISVAALGK